MSAVRTICSSPRQGEPPSRRSNALRRSSYIARAEPSRLPRARACALAICARRELQRHEVTSGYARGWIEWTPAPTRWSGCTRRRSCYVADREPREDVEGMLKDHMRPVSVLCTTTLEMGIDIGDMKAIAIIRSV